MNKQIDALAKITYTLLTLWAVGAACCFFYACYRVAVHFGALWAFVYLLVGVLFASFTAARIWHERKDMLLVLLLSPPLLFTWPLAILVVIGINLCICLVMLILAVLIKFGGYVDYVCDKLKR